MNLFDPFVLAMCGFAAATVFLAGVWFGIFILTVL